MLFVDGSACFAKGRNQNEMHAEHIDSILEAFRTGDDPDGDGGVQVRPVPIDEIEANGWDLNIGRYLRTAAADTISVDDALTQLRTAQTALRDTEAELEERFKVAGYV